MLGFQLCRMVTSYVQRHTKTRLCVKSKTANTMNVLLGPKYDGVEGNIELVVFGQIQPHKI